MKNHIILVCSLPMPGCCLVLSRLSRKALAVASTKGTSIPYDFLGAEWMRSHLYSPLREAEFSEQHLNWKGSHLARLQLHTVALQCVLYIINSLISFPIILIISSLDFSVSSLKPRICKRAPFNPLYYCFLLYRAGMRRTCCKRGEGFFINLAASARPNQSRWLIASIKAFSLESLV